MKKIVSASLSLLFLLSALLLPISAAKGPNRVDPGFGSVTTGEVGFSQTLVDSLDKDGKLKYYTSWKEQVEPDEPAETVYGFQTIALADVPRLGTIVTKNADGSYSLNYSGAGGYTSSSVWKISDASDMVAFSIVCNWSSDTPFRDKYVVMENDIDMTGVTMQPIGTAWDGSSATNKTPGTATPLRIDGNLGFMGIFDGLGHSVKNLDMSSSSATAQTTVALFACLNSGVIMNLVIDKSCTFAYTGTNNSAATAAVAATAKGSNIVTHALATNYIAQSRIGDSQMGSDEPKSDNTQSTSPWYIFNVKNDANVSAECGCVGGIVANTWNQGVSGLPFIQNCTNNGNVTAKGTANMYNGNGWTTVTANAGGIVGYIAKRTLRLLDCVNTGAVEAPGIAAGIWAGTSRFEDNEGQGGAREAVFGCVNYGTVKGGSSAGGILGQIDKQNMAMRDCTNYGTVTATTEDKAGQLFGLGGKYTAVSQLTSGAQGFWKLNRVMSAETVKVAGIQKATAKTTLEGKDYRSVRLVGMIDLPEADLEDYTAVGFHVTATYTTANGEKTQTLDATDKAVYTEILAQGANGEYEALTAEGGYYFAVVLKNIPCATGSVEFTLTPYYVNADGYEWLGTAATFTAEMN